MSKSAKLWSPSPEVISNANLTKYMEWLSPRGLIHADYRSLWQWSIDEPGEFWKSLVDWFDVQLEGDYKFVIKGDTMPSVTWFDGTQVSFAEHVFRNATNERPALVHATEESAVSEISWSQLKVETASLADFLIKSGVQEGDRVAAYLPCNPEATIAFLAANSIGAIWSSCSPDFGAASVIDRFSQIEPVVLIATEGYNYGGKYFDKQSVVKEIQAAIPSIKKVIIVTTKNAPAIGPDWVRWSDATANTSAVLKFIRVPFSRPIWIVFSSGTTGLPKAIVHSTGGIMLEQLKYLTFHNDLHKGERLFWYTTTGWMMWNYVQGALLCGATAVLYDGSPAFPDLGRLWRFCEEAKINHFGTSAGFILACMKADVKPGHISTLRSIGSTGSTLPPEGFDWVYQQVGANVWLTSMSGGTDVASAFVGGNPLWPVYAGEIQCRALGCALEAWDETGKPVVREVGEMVITKPMPSMPVYFWKDPDGKRYQESYFEMFPSVWRHGDWIEITSNDGVIIYGRSDATLNRGGVRIGTSEVYRAVDKVIEVKDSLILSIEKPGGEFHMPMFVVMKEGNVLTDELRKKIGAVLRADYSPRHVPDEIIAVPDIPYTISGKKTETPVKKILMGKDPSKVINRGALRNPESLDFFVAFYKKQTGL